MKNRMVMAVILAGILATTAAPARADKKSKDFERGQAFCPAHVLVMGGILIQPGRCYLLAMVRNQRGTFLAFLPVSTERFREQRRLDREDGQRIFAHVLYLVPIESAGISAVVIPMNTIRLVGIHEEDREDEEDEDGEHKVTDKVVLVVTGVPIPNLAVTFVVRF